MGLMISFAVNNFIKILSCEYHNNTILFHLGNLNQFVHFMLKNLKGLEKIYLETYDAMGLYGDAVTIRQI